jgi:CRISPR system Cascade subunit CasC
MIRPVTIKLQFHVLTVLPPHNVNRDEDGNPKRVEFGGSVRGRISSQAKKRALRFAPHFPCGQRALRTREAGVEVFDKLSKNGIPEDNAILASIAVNTALGSGDGAADVTGKVSIRDEEARKAALTSVRNKLARG